MEQMIRPTKNYQPLGITLSLEAEAFTVTHEIDGRSTAGMTIKDATDSMTFSERQQIIYSDLDDNAEFAGVVSSCQEIRIPGTDYVFHTIDAVDYTAILDWRIANDAYETTDLVPLYAGNAVQAMMTEYLADEGISAGTIETGPELTQIVISEKTLREAYDKIAEACGFVWYIDYDMKLYFYDRTKYPADWNITDGDDIISESFTVTRSNPLYRNTENILGGWVETDVEQTENFMGDGTTKTFPMAYQVNRIDTVTVNGATQTVGEKGAAGTYQFLYSIGSETVTFTQAPPAGQAVVINYYGRWRAKTTYDDETLIASNKLRQGFGSGIIEHATTDESLTSATAANEYATAKVGEYGVDGIVVNYSTRRTGLAVGTIQTITWGGLTAEDCLITRITLDSKDNDTIYHVEAVSGPVNQNWENYFRDQFTPQTSVGESVSSGALVAILKQYNHTYLSSQPTYPDIFGTAVCGVDVKSTDWPCFDPTDRTSYIELQDFGHAVLLRKIHTSIPDPLSEVSFKSNTFIGSAEGNGAVAYIKFYGGDSASATNGSGVVVHTVTTSLVKSMLVSWQIEMTYINGA